MKTLPKGQQASEWRGFFEAAIHGGAGAIAFDHEKRVDPQAFVDWCDVVATLAVERALKRGAIE